MNVIKFGVIFIVLSLLTFAQADDTKISPSPAQELLVNQKNQTLAGPEKTLSESTNENEYDVVYVDEDGNEVDYVKDNDEFTCINCDGEGDIEEDSDIHDDDDDDDEKLLYIDEYGNKIYDDGEYEGEEFDDEE